MRKILFVDDEIDIADSVKQGLELQGLLVDSFSDPQKALEHFKPGTYEVAVLDIKMPKMNGFQLYREIIRRDDNTKVIFITAFDDVREEFGSAFPEAEAQRFLRKPFSITKLKERVLQRAGKAEVSA